MRHFDLFEFYRFMLAVLVSIYGTLQLVVFIWRWGGVAGDARTGSALAYRYMALLLLRTRFRRFARDLLVIGSLAAVLLLLIRFH